MLTVSVVIATKDRAEQLRTICLPSLAGQHSAPQFEVIVWDASENDKSKRVVEGFVASHDGLTLRYFKAPRVGLSAQRNDAVTEAKGEIVFFIDDDSEVSPDGISTLAEMFAENRRIVGGCLPLDYRWPPEAELATAIKKTSGFGSWLAAVYSRVFEPSKRATGYFPPIPPVRPGPISYLFGCDMAFRKCVFSTHRFEERLQRFSSYVMCDDLIFSRVLMRQGLELQVAEKGCVIHWAAPGGRVKFGFNSGRVEGYDAGLVWWVSVFPWARWTVFPFVWARLGGLSGALLPCLRWPWQFSRWKRVAGYLAGLWIFFWEEIVGLAPRDTQPG